MQWSCISAMKKLFRRISLPLSTDRATALMKRSHFYEAIVALDELLAKELETGVKLGVLANKAVCQIMTRQSYDDTTDQMIGLVGYDRLLNQAAEAKANSEYVKAVVLYECGGVKYCREGYTHMSHKALNKVLFEIFQLVRIGGRLHEITRQIVQRATQRMLQTSDSMQDIDKQVLAKGSCLRSIALFDLELGRSKHARAANEQGIQLLAQHFGEDAKNYAIYSVMLHNLGLCMENQGELLEAQRLYQQAMAFAEPVEDYLSQDVKEEDLRTSRENLARIANKLWSAKQGENLRTSSETSSVTRGEADTTCPSDNVTHIFQQHQTTIFAKNIESLFLQCDAESSACPLKKSFPELNLSEMTLAGDGVYFDENHQLREDYRVFSGVLDGLPPERVAVKIIELGHIKGVSSRESLILCKLAPHPNVLLYRKSGTFKFTGIRSLFLVTELCDSETLFEKINESRFDMSEKMRILQHCVNGLKHVHDSDVAHRDLKPQNVLISIKNGDARIADFGFSKELLNGRSVVSQSATRRGTDGWRAPETYKDCCINPKQADIFSLGLLFHFVLSDGKHPFGEDHGDWYYKIKHGHEMDLGNLDCPNIEVAKELISKMLSRDPALRPTVGEVLGHEFFHHE